ncbi:MAG: DUF1269 domain-containing protein [Gammaproteobacteria bacterium]|nr:DUF1269 domain-containing protein [Gammaproteobacteria bacterium]
MLLARIESRHLHVLARQDIALGDLPEASLLERSDLKEAAGHGLAVGGAVGAIAGLAAAAFAQAGVALEGGLVAAMALGGAVFGAWVSSMIGVSVPNRELKKFEAAIQRGEMLMMIDVPKDRVEEIEYLVASHHPEVAFGGIEPNLPAFP